ncbi:hypothetical protein M407DRAFT_99150 [Tulasnella calospora MUT 4182]|uniref:Endosomal/vacuolar adapter protein YPT35 n=1 Tax=Tulasnella calospora MUT 4182 TaxID=1051891 RepID=A0A0C3QGJ6_9AGAM|nr:hypothetical protein M407DRAFT_99150 [Tulasnella calospora MUT 4182]
MTSITEDQGLPTSYQSRLILLAPDHESDSEEIFNAPSGDQHQSRSVPIAAPQPIQTGRRTPSLFSNEIWLEDNTGNSQNFATSVTVPGWSTVGDTRAGGYIVYDCTITLKSGNEVRILKRFSAFEALAHDLEHSISRALLHNIPPLPSKTTLGKYRPSFLEKRRKQLETWLAAVMLHPDIGGSDAVKRWVTE